MPDGNKRVEGGRMMEGSWEAVRAAFSEGDI